MDVPFFVRTSVSLAALPGGAPTAGQSPTPMSVLTLSKSKSRSALVCW
jgi:hypothetical protein